MVALRLSIVLALIFCKQRYRDVRATPRRHPDRKDVKVDCESIGDCAEVVDVATGGGGEGAEGQLEGWMYV
jgi:hypothetical protein